MEDMETEENDLAAPLFSILKIDVILRKLETFLDIKDMGRMRCVSRGMNELILYQSRFLSKSEIVLRESVYDDASLKTLSFQPKNVKLVVFKVGFERNEDGVSKGEDLIKKGVVDSVCNVVEKCERLEIAGEEKGDGMFWFFYNLSKIAEDPINIDYDEIKLPDHFPPVPDIISCVKNLKALKLQFGAQLFLADAEAKHAEALSGIQYMEVDETFPCYCPRIFLKLKGLSRIRGYTKCDCYSEREPPEIHEQHERCRDLEVNNRETLTELDLKGHPTWFCSTYYAHKFPSLKSLELDAGKTEHNGSSAIVFLENHIDQLEELTIWVHSPGADQVLQIISKCNQNFKTLKLILEKEVKRSSLTTCMKYIRNAPLEVLELTTFWNHDDRKIGAPLDIFSFLPTTLRSFNLCSSSGMFYDPSKLIRVPLLTSLELEYFNGNLNSTLQGICKYLPKLQGLSITDDREGASWESEAGGCATTSPSPGAETFSNLKDLREILIGRGPDLSMDMLNGINIPKLKWLKVPNVSSRNNGSRSDSVDFILKWYSSYATHDTTLIFIIFQKLATNVLSTLFHKCPALKYIYFGRDSHVQRNTFVHPAEM